jgi:putative endonuclease
MFAHHHARAWVYILASRGAGTLYIGVTGDLRARIRQHKHGVHEGFTKRYRVHRLVYFEEFQNVRRALDREEQLKGWARDRKIALIESVNSAWVDLAADWW